MLRKLFTISLLFIFTIVTSGVALYHCCCGISVVEEAHGCCGSHKKCDTHMHYYKLDNVFQIVNKIENNPVLHVVTDVPYILTFECIVPEVEHTSNLSHAPPLLRAVHLAFIQVYRL